MLANITAYVIDSCGEIKGKKAFQKILYFLTETGVPTGLSYTLYHYGPYSPELDFQTHNLELKGAIEVKEQRIGYKIEKGRNADELKNDAMEYKELIDDVLSKLPFTEPMQLELLSTIHYVAKVQKCIYDILDEDKVVKEVIKIKKDKFSEDMIRRAYKELLEKKLLDNDV